MHNQIVILIHESFGISSELFDDFRIIVNNSITILLDHCGKSTITPHNAMMSKHEQLLQDLPHAKHLCAELIQSENVPLFDKKLGLGFDIHWKHMDLEIFLCIVERINVSHGLQEACQRSSIK